MKGKRSLSVMMVACLLAAMLAGCTGGDPGIGDGAVNESEQVIGSEQEAGEQTGADNETGEWYDPNAVPENFQCKKPNDEEIAAVEVKSGADFATVSMEALQGYWYCDDGGGAEIYLEVDGDEAVIYETIDGQPAGVWTGRGAAYISEPGTNGWKNPGLEIRDDEGMSIALIVLRRVEENYFTAANAGVFYRVIEK